MKRQLIKKGDRIKIVSDNGPWPIGSVGTVEVGGYNFVWIKGPKVRRSMGGSWKWKDHWPYLTSQVEKWK